MNHIYQNIPGMFDFHELYSMMVAKAPDNSRFVEVGAFLGKSSAYLAVEIINSDKNIVLDVIDTFKGSFNVDEERSYVNEFTGDYYSTFLNNVSPVIGVLRPRQMESIDASKYYSMNSLDFVFIDANHDYEYVKRDIESWLPKVKKGGYIGGHDYRRDCKGVWKAVNEMKYNVKKIKNSWLVQV